jgi:hypothetical protein
MNRIFLAATTLLMAEDRSDLDSLLLGAERFAGAH